MRAQLLLSAWLIAAALMVSTDHAAAGGGGCGDAAPPVPVAATTVVMRHSCFQPGVVTVEPGDTVEIVNDDPMLHNVYGPGWYHGDLRPGEVMSRTFDEEGTYTFACTLHPGMTGAVVVSDTEPASVMAPLSDGGAGASGALVGGIGLGLLVGLGTGWALRRVTHRSNDCSHRASGLHQTSS